MDDSLQAVATEAYRQSPYPSMIHPFTNVDHIAAIARLTGMRPPDVRRCRILEVGVGDGLNSLSMAQMLPDADVVGIDIDEVAIARGRERVALAGATNCRLEVADLLNPGAPALAGPFDFIIAHGVYAWVPPPVADALLALVARCLSPQGVAFISFNALPGGYLRIALRNAMLRACDGVFDPQERLARALSVAKAIAEPNAGDGPITAAWRAAAKDVVERPHQILVHDELGSDFHPLYLQTLIDRARPLGLSLLGDATPLLIDEAWVGDADVPDEYFQSLVETRAIARDDIGNRTFRRALLIRTESEPSRRLDPRVVETLYATGLAEEVEEGMFRYDGAQVRCTHPVLAPALRRLIAAFPQRIAVRDLGLDDVSLISLAALFDQSLVSLTTLGSLCAAEPTDPPIVSPVARAMLTEGAYRLPTLHHLLAEPDAGAIRAAALMDGSRSLAELRAWMAAEEIDADVVFAGLVGQGLLLPA